MKLVEAIDAALAFVRDHSEAMSRDELNEFARLAEAVYVGAIRADLLDALPQVPQLTPQLEMDGLTPVQFETKLNLPGDWDTGPPADGELMPSQPLVGADLEEPSPKAFLVCASPRWFDDMRVLRTLAANDTVDRPAEEERDTTPRLTVDLGRRTITLDGTPYDVGSELAIRWVKVLADHPGEWISGSALPDYDTELDGVRTDRLNLPQEILNLIDSKPGAGSRINLGRK